MPEPVVEVVDTLKERVAAEIGSQDIIASVVLLEVEKEKARRIQIMTDGYRLVLGLDAEFETKLRSPDVKTFDSGGADVSNAYSEKKNAKRKKNRERVSKLRDLINKAAAEKTMDAYEKLEKATKQ